jgi:cation diffusion facilitator family transporter
VRAGRRPEHETAGLGVTGAAACAQEPAVSAPVAPQLLGRYAEMRRITIIGALVNLVLTVGKIGFGILGQSHALVADGVHSLSDLVSDGLVLVAARHSHRDADAAHPYGHARFETAATVLVGVILIALAVALAADAARRLVNPALLLHPGWLALAVALASIVSKEWLYRYTVRVATRLRSKLLLGNAWHHRSDAISSVVVVAGVAGAMLGLPYLDALGSIAVAFMIAWVGWDLGRESVLELVDTALDPQKVAAIRERILAVDGVQALHLLRTRSMGADALVDVHILVDPRVSVSEGHQISETVRALLMKEVEGILDVTVHIDPEDDEKGSPNRHLPLRGEFMERLRRRWAPIDISRQVQGVTLHYLDGRIDVEVVLPLASLRDIGEARALAQSLEAAARAERDVGKVRVHFL